MPIDFKKLNDPAWQEQMRQEREAESARLEARQKEFEGLVDTCLKGIESLSDTERSLVRSCRTLLCTYRFPSEKQEKWLRDIAAKLMKNSPQAEGV